MLSRFPQIDAFVLAIKISFMFDVMDLTRVETAVTAQGFNSVVLHIQKHILGSVNEYRQTSQTRTLQRDYGI